MTSIKEIEGLLAGIPPVQYVAAGSCGVKYVSKGMEIICCRQGKAEFTTLASDPLDNKAYQSSNCRFHKNCSDDASFRCCCFQHIYNLFNRHCYTHILHPLCA